MTATEKLVLLAINSYQTKGRSTSVMQCVLAKASNLHPKTVSRAIESLEQKGYPVVERQAAGNESGQIVLYRAVPQRQRHIFLPVDKAVEDHLARDTEFADRASQGTLSPPISGSSSFEKETTAQTSRGISNCYSLKKAQQEIERNQQAKANRMAMEARGIPRDRGYDAELKRKKENEAIDEEIAELRRAVSPAVGEVEKMPQVITAAKSVEYLAEDQVSGGEIQGKEQSPAGIPVDTNQSPPDFTPAVFRGLRDAVFRSKLFPGMTKSQHEARIALLRQQAQQIADKQKAAKVE